MKKLITHMMFLLFALGAEAWNTPSINSPADGASTWTEAYFDWNAVTSTQYYQFQLDTVATFNSPGLFNMYNAYINSSGSNTDTHADIINLRFGQKYYWRIRAFVTGDTSAWSVTRSIITRDYVTPSSPLSGTTNLAGIRLNWAPHDGVAKYEWQADTSVSFASAAFKTGQTTYINSTDGNTDTQWDLTGLLFGKKYYWRIRAMNNAPDTSAWTQNDFTIRDSVTLTSPANGANIYIGGRLDWVPFSGVSKYEWQIDTTTNFTSGAMKTGQNSYINSTDGNTDTQWDLSDLYFGKTYYWHVRAINAADTSGWGEMRNFSTRNYVTLSSPADLSVNRSTAGVTLNWAPHTGVQAYQVQIDSSYLFNTPALHTATQAYINSTDGNSDTQYGTGVLAANTIYFWRVRAYDAVDTCAWTQWAFNTGSTAIVYPTAPVLTAPANGSSIAGTTTTLQWNAVTNATGYTYYYSDNSNFNNAISGTTSTTSVAINSLLGSTTYYWKVVAVNGNLPSPASSTWTFITPLGTITTGNVSASSYCSGGLITVPFSTTSTFTGSSTFTIQLSDANGSFSTPTNIGTATGANVTSVNGTIPAGAATGSGYKVRIVSTLPTITGSAASVAFGILNSNTPPVISGTTGIACAGSTVTLSVPTITGASYTWVLPDNSNQFTPSITISNFSIADTGMYGVIVSVGSCFSSPAGVNIAYNSSSGTTPVVSSNANAICLGRQLSLSVTTQSNATYSWAGPNGFTSSSATPVLTMPANGAGTYSVTVTAGGCSTTGAKTIALNNPSLRTIDSTVCNGVSVFGRSATGTYRDTLVAANTCDSIRTLNLTVRAQITGTSSQTICYGQSYAGHNATGVYTDHYTAANGCDSARTLTLTVRPQNTTNVNATVCTGHSYAGHSTAGTYTDTYTDSHGCDSVRTLVLTIANQITSTVSQTICAGQTYAGHNATGTFTDTYTSSGGCDSVRTLHLTVLPVNTTSITQTVCYGQSYGGHSASGTYTDHFTSTAGCDSARTLALTVLPQNGSSTVQIICAGQVFQGHSSTGTFTEPHTDSHGCDSNYVLYLTVLPVGSSTITQTICQGQSYLGYNATGTYVDTLSADNGCDSIRTLHLTVSNGQSFTQSIDMCSNDTLIINNVQVTQSGTYSETRPGSGSDCDSMFTYTVTVHQAPVTPVIAFDPNIPYEINAPDGYDTYTWYLDSTVIFGNFGSSIFALDSGAYTLVVSSLSSPCYAVSNTLYYGVTGISQTALSGIKVYPNPTTDQLVIDMATLPAGGTATISDLAGKEIITVPLTTMKQKLNLSSLAGGSYLLHLRTATVSRTLKIQKL